MYPEAASTTDYVSNLRNSFKSNNGLYEKATAEDLTGK